MTIEKCPKCGIVMIQSQFCADRFMCSDDKCGIVKEMQKGEWRISKR